MHVGDKQFHTTQWSLVVRAAQSHDLAARPALAQLCGRYWLPIHAYVMRRINDREDARDLTQAFFTHLLEKNSLAHADQSRGRFRSFLLTSIKNFITNDYERKQARRRGGGVKILSLDFDSGESRMNYQPTHNDTAERIFEQQWVLSLLDIVAGGLRTEYEAAGKSRQFVLLQGAITANEKLNYTEIAGELAVSEEAARQMASRLRKRYRDLLRNEVAQTLSEPGDVEDEIRGLFETLSR